MLPSFQRKQKENVLGLIIFVFVQLDVEVGRTPHWFFMDFLHSAVVFELIIIIIIILPDQTLKVSSSGTDKRRIERACRSRNVLVQNSRLSLTSRAIREWVDGWGGMKGWRDGEGSSHGGSHSARCDTLKVELHRFRPYLTSDRLISHPLTQQQIRIDRRRTAWLQDWNAAEMTFKGNLSHLCFLPDQMSPLRRPLRRVSVIDPRRQHIPVVTNCCGRRASFGGSLSPLQRGTQSHVFLRVGVLIACDIYQLLMSCCWPFINPGN